MIRAGNFQLPAVQLSGGSAGDDPKRAVTDTRIEISSETDALVFTPVTGWEAQEVRPEQEAKNDPGTTILSESRSIELERFASLPDTQMLVLCGVTPSWAVQAAKGGLHKAMLRAPEGVDGKLVVYGSKLRIENLFEVSILARCLGREAIRVHDLQELDGLDLEALASTLVKASKPIHMSTETMPRPFAEAVPEILSSLHDALESHTPLRWEIPADRM